MDDLLKEFLTETSESLAELDIALLQLERVPDHKPTITMIFRLMHTIKGTCGFLGLSRLEKVAHAAENVLGRLRDDELVATADLVTTVLSALDGIKAIVAGLAVDGREPEGDDSALVARLAAAELGAEQGQQDTAIAEEPPVPAPAAAEMAEPAPMPEATGAAGKPAAPRAKAAKSDAKRPAVAAAAPEAPPPAEPALVETKPTEARVAETRSEEHRPSEPRTVEARPPAAEAPDGVNAGPTTIRVAVDVLETLMTLVSELVLTRNQLLQIARVQGQQGHDDSATAFATPLQRLSQITSDLQEGVMKTRMQPVGNAWNKLPRVVRDLAQELNKKIELVTTGAETELDRQVLELIRDPLTHMVRNSADHGIEMPAVRRSAGKPELGRITLSAYHEGGHIVIGLADDGRGLDLGRIRAKALSRGLATEAELNAMPDAEIHRFIFHPGFSTAEAITSVSGRGVGMDVVITNIERIGGSIDLRTRAGEGTNFTIKIPLTLAIVSALIVEAGGERFAIPQLTVAELVSARPASNKTLGEGDSVIEQLNGTAVLRLRDRLLPLVSLAHLLQLDDADSAARAASDALNHEARHVIVAQAGGSLLGIVVDRVFDTEEIVVKPVTPILRHLTVFGGTTILGDGSVIMILDAGGIARAAGTAGDGRSDGRQDERRDSASHGSMADVANSEDRTAILLFRVGGGVLAVPLGLVARLEEIGRDRIEFADGASDGAAAVTQYRGQLMPLIPIGGTFDRERDLQRVLVFSEMRDASGTESSMGLVVDEIVDVVDEQLKIALSSARPGLLGTAVIAGRAAGVLDTRFWLRQATQDWFRARPPSETARQSRILIVEDSDFFRQLLMPTLSAAGFKVTAASSASQALKLRDSGAMFDAIISDIEMPEMDGRGLARSVRAGGPWMDMPMIALSGRARPKDVAAARDAGFTEFVEKFEPEPLLATLRQCLANAGARAAERV